MDPFSVTCASCNGKLIIKNEKLAGQIVPCPRCKAPVAIPNQKRVLFTPPQGMVADSVAITKGVDEDWGQDLENALAAHRDEITQARPPSQSQVIDKQSLLRSGTNEEDEFRLQPLDSVGFPVAPPVVPISTLAPPVSPIRKKAIEQKKPSLLQPIVIAGLGICGLVIASGLFYLFTVLVKPNNVANNKSTVTPSPTPSPIVPTPTQSGESETAPLNNRLPLVEPSLTIVENPDKEVIKPDLTSSDTKPIETKNDDPKGVEPKSVEPKVAEPKAVEPNAVASNGTGDTEIPLIFKKMLGGGLPKGFTVEDSDTVQPKNNEPEVFEPFLARNLPTAPKADPNEALKMPVGKMKMRNVSLADFIGTISSITNVGISLDVESIAAIGLAPSSKIEVDSTQSDVGSLLSSVLTPLGLRVLPNLDQGLLYVGATDEALLAKLPKTFSLSGMVDPNRTQELAEILKQLLPDESTHWKLEGTEVVWQPTAVPQIKFRIAVVLDRIRVALGQPSLSGYHPSGLLLGLDIDQVQPKLLKKSDRENPQKRPLAQILQSAARERGMVLLIDWNSLWRHGITPATEELCVARDRTYVELFREFEEQYVLEMTAIDQNTLWLTTPETRRLASQIRVVPIKDGDTLEKLRNKLRPLSPTNLQRQSRLVVVELPGKPFAIVRVCPPTIHQLQTDWTN